MVAPRTLTRRQAILGTAGLAAMAVTAPLLRERSASATVDIYVVRSGPLRMRSGPGLGYSVLASLPTGTRMEIIDNGGTADGYQWVKVWVSSLDKTGFVARTFIAREGTSGGGTFAIGSTVHVDTASGSGANMRSVPAITAGVVRIVANGTTGTVQSGETLSGGYAWVKVTMGGSTGYMATTVLAAGAGVGTPPPPASGGTFPIGSTVHVDSGPGTRANMRSGAGLSYAVIARFAHGTSGTVQSGETARDGYRWVKVTMGGTTGYMATTVLAAGSGTTAPPPPASDTTETFPVGSTVHLDTTTGGAANLRSGPGLSYAVVKIVPNGTTAGVLSEKTTADGMAWVKIAVVGAEGWMSNGCLAAGPGADAGIPNPPPAVVVSDGPLNVRATPGLGGTILATVPTGTTGDMLSDSQEADGYKWMKIRFNDQARTTGWVVTAFLAFS